MVSDEKNYFASSYWDLSPANTLRSSGARMADVFPGLTGVANLLAKHSTFMDYRARPNRLDIAFPKTCRFLASGPLLRRLRGALAFRCGADLEVVAHIREPLTPEQVADYQAEADKLGVGATVMPYTLLPAGSAKASDGRTH